MSRIAPIESSQASPKSIQLLGVVEKKLGVVPNMMKTMAHSSAVLDAYLSFSNALSAAKLSAPVREQIALAVAEVNACEYCLSAHTFLGAKLGVAPSDIESARRGHSLDAKVDAILGFSRELVVRRGEVRDQDLSKLRAAGVSDAEITEIVATVALNVFTNWFNHVTDPAVDFPVVKPGRATAATSSSTTPSAAAPAPTSV